MAQTIAVQRGSTSVTADGSSKVTLFTQSSGTATRVIVGGLSVGYASSSGGASYMAFINVNGSGSYLPVIWRQHNQYSTRYLNTFPNSESSTGISLSGQYNDTISQTNGISFGSPYNAGFSTTLGGANGAVYQGSITASYAPINISPGQFWMANGDSLVLAAAIDPGGTANVIYHFITVTES